MTWEQKLAALNAIGECSLLMRSPGDWYVWQEGVRLSDGDFETTGGGDGVTPEATVNDTWRKMVTDLKDNAVIVCRKSNGDRRYVRWNEFMWVDVPEPK